ncbi:uncharacterized protein LOC143817951 [Ranitomeya variabilis]|uniref:uncharacterized protein LOC143817951 n=1 Tax=Ranitomeya variabilis TaxID=490064 RepID=UPI0040572623
MWVEPTSPNHTGRRHEAGSPGKVPIETVNTPQHTDAAVDERGRKRQRTCATRAGSQVPMETGDSPDNEDAAVDERGRTHKCAYIARSGSQMRHPSTTPLGPANHMEKIRGMVMKISEYHDDKEPSGVIERLQCFPTAKQLLTAKVIQEATSL